ncbi:hypothetical protein AALP_AA5G224000 [Arabis alpina]|uniref:RING-type E3 ubiquitin transferase n=1 Tax=Arabis alpina TaxID=50452 RepID=A0A087GYS0_ARAAL|nr:hypothetical protein AALP_AA5G224000 [Arabis alpina]
MVGASFSGEGNGSSRKRQLSTTLLDPDSLHCPICFELLTIPIFQCDNGHLACSSCCPKLRNKCPACALPIGHIRCRAMETVLESVFVPCRNAKLGCTKNFSYGNELAHEKECAFSLCSCPVQDCNYAASYEHLYVHYKCNHGQICPLNLFSAGISFTAKMNISDKISMQTEYRMRLLFAVQCFREPYGVYVTVNCIAPSAPEVGEFSYHLSYTVDGHTMTYEAPKMKMVLEVSFQTPKEKFMLIPDSSLRGDVLEMKLCIRKLKKE